MVMNLPIMDMDASPGSPGAIAETIVPIVAITVVLGITGGAVWLSNMSDKWNQDRQRAKYFPKVTQKAPGVYINETNQLGKKDIQVVTKEGSLSFNGLGDDLYQLQNYQQVDLVSKLLKDVNFIDLNHDCIPDIFISAPQGNYSFMGTGNGIYKLEPGQQGNRGSLERKEMTASYLYTMPGNPELMHLEDMARSVDEQLRIVLADRGYT